MGILTLLIVLPLGALALLAMVPETWTRVFRWTTLGVTLVQLVVVLAGLLPVLMHPAAGESGFVLQEQADWITLDMGSAGLMKATWLLAVDGMGGLLILLTVLILPIAVISSFEITQSVKGYFLLFLLLDASLIGVFCALDFLLFYIFYELMLLPMFFLIGIWGGARREYASVKFFLYTLVGSVFMLLVMVGLMFSFTDPVATAAAGHPVHTLSMLDMMQTGPEGWPSNLISGSFFDAGRTLLGLNARLLAFLVLFIGFAIKIPAVPLHTWLPDAHVEAPTPVSVILAGILLKVGGYGMVRICMGLFPEGMIVYSPWIAGAGILAIVYGAMVSMAQQDYKRLVAYSSVSHMGYVLLGLGALQVTGLTGAVYQLFTHGITSAMLFILVGVLYVRVHDRHLPNFSGLWDLMPRYAFFTLVGFFASMGLPGLCSFVSELLVFMGVLGSSIPLGWILVALSGIVWSAVYFLRAFRQLFFGTFDAGHTSTWRPLLTDLTLREYVMLVPLAVLAVGLGVWPGPVLDMIDDSLAHMLHQSLTTGHRFLSAPIP
ncbi:MAG: NADH-quinone oxidoreductase subunit M [Bacteroidia bacterium]|nr:NADH-quinone oxidoreductase subunit M [Bacteroidia bacterium]